MSFDNDYPKRKDHRKPFRGAKAIDCSCRNHGSCPMCLKKEPSLILKKGLQPTNK